MRLITRAMIILALLVGTGACAMADTVWTFNNVVFDNSHFGAFDPNQLTGTFTTSVVGSTWTVTGFSLTIAPIPTLGDTPYADDIFTITQVLGSPYLPGEIGISNADFSKYIALIPNSPLSPSGGTFSLGAGFDCNGCGTLITNLDPTVAGTDSRTATPEPGSGLLLGCGLVGLALFSRKRLGLE
jgi:hypothetical protein